MAELTWTLVDDHAIMFLKDETEDEVFTEHFSVPSPPPRKSKSSVVGQRAIVVHEGRDGVEGRWKCSRDRGADADCTHITRAKAHLVVLDSESPNRYVLADLEEPEVAITSKPGRSRPWKEAHLTLTWS